MNNVNCTCSGLGQWELMWVYSSPHRTYARDLMALRITLGSGADVAVGFGGCGGSVVAVVVA